VTTADEVAALDRLGIDAQVGMALYTGVLPLHRALLAPTPGGLVPTVVADERGQSLGLCWSNEESVRVALEEGIGAYWSRRRGLWRKGETSGHRQRLIRIDLDCDRDALRFTVAQQGPFCHVGTHGCFGPASGLGALEATVAERIRGAPPGSYTRRLLDDPALLCAKLVEEARELAEAAPGAHTAAELADLLYFAVVAAARGGASLADAERILDQRSLALTRRPGDAKEAP
jgi:phosphoribosyl-ATP pyrophosphohydrolase